MKYFFLLFVLALNTIAWSQMQRPNIFFVMSDDHASQAISAYDARLICTPNLDRLAREGMKFTRVFAANAICTPSRATILTGQYSHINGVPVFNALDPEKRTVAHRLHEAGYYTSMIGKWHLGSDPQGFDHWEIFPGQGAYYDPVLYTREGSKKYTGGYATEVVTQLAIQDLRSRPKEKPFFMMVHHKAPHRPWQPLPRLAEKWKKRAIPEPETLFDSYATRGDAIRNQKQSIARDLKFEDVKETPPTNLVGQALTRWYYQRYMQDYLACIESIDDSMGELLAELEQQKILDNTLVIYTSDQGFFLGEHGLYDKRFMYEECLRMPFLVRWGKQIKAGSVQNAICVNCDFAPTFLDLAGVATPAEMQGASMKPLFSGTTPNTWRTSMYYRYYHDPGDHNTARHYGVRTATHKLIYFDGLNQWECYDLLRDPHELNNIYADPAAQSCVAELKAELHRLQVELKDTENRYADRNTWPKESSYRKAPAQRKVKP